MTDGVPTTGGTYVSTTVTITALHVQHPVPTIESKNFSNEFTVSTREKVYRIILRLRNGADMGRIKKKVSCRTVDCMIHKMNKLTDRRN